MSWLRRFALALLLASTLPLQATEKSITLAEIRAAKFEVTTLNGKVVALDEILGQGRPVLLEFWATWCAPCKKTMPHLMELSRRHGEDLLVLGLTVENPEKDMEKVRQFVSRMEITYPIAFAPRELYRLVNDKEEIGVPKIVVFDRSGHVVEHVRTYSPLTNRRVAAAVGRAVRQSKER